MWLYPILTEQFNLLHLYYKQQNTYSTVLNDTLFIHIRAPIVIDLNTYDAFKINTYPVPIHSAEGTSQPGYTMIQNIPQYLAVSKMEDTYQVLTIEQATDCINHINLNSAY